MERQYFGSRRSRGYRRLLKSHLSASAAKSAGAYSIIAIHFNSIAIGVGNELISIVVLHNLKTASRLWKMGRQHLVPADHADIADYLNRIYLRHQRNLRELIRSLQYTSIQSRSVWAMS